MDQIVIGGARARLVRPLPPPPAAPASSAGSAPARPESEPVERGERFFSGSPEADERNAAMAGRRHDEKDKRRG